MPKAIQRSWKRPPLNAPETTCFASFLRQLFWRHCIKSARSMTRSSLVWLRAWNIVFGRRGRITVWRRTRLSLLWVNGLNCGKKVSRWGIRLVLSHYFVVDEKWTISENGFFSFVELIKVSHLISSLFDGLMDGWMDGFSVDLLIDWLLLRFIINGMHFILQLFYSVGFWPGNGRSHQETWRRKWRESYGRPRYRSRTHDGAGRSVPFVWWSRFLPPVGEMHKFHQADGLLLDRLHHCSG